MNPGFESFGNPAFTSTPSSTFAGRVENKINLTPFGKPRIFELPGSRTSRFVSVRRRVKFIKDTESDGEHKKMSEQEDERQDRHEEDQRDRDNEERDKHNESHEEEFTWDDEKLEQAKECYKKNQAVNELLAELQTARELLDREKLAQQNEIAKLKAVETAQNQRHAQLNEIEKQMKAQVEKNNPIRNMGARKSGGPPQHQLPQPNAQRQSIPTHTILGGPTNQIIPLNYIQQPNLAQFEAERGDDPRIFLDKYEKLTSSHSDRARVDGLGNYLKGSALDWITVLEKERRSRFDFDQSGIASNEWYEMKWETLRELFENEFAEKRAKEIFRTNQLAGESGLTYFYRMLKLHQQSGLDLDEEQLATLMLTHMGDNFKDNFEFKNYDSLDKLKEDIRRCDAMRKAELNHRSKEKRKANIATLEMEAETHLKKKVKTEIVESNKELKDLTTKINALQQQMSTFQQNKDTPRNNNNSFPKQENFRNTNRNFSGRFGNRVYDRNFQQYNNNGGNKNNRVCYNCRKLGHEAKNYWSPPNFQSRLAIQNGNNPRDQRGQNFRNQSNRGRNNRVFNRTDVNHTHPSHNIASGNSTKPGN